MQIQDEARNAARARLVRAMAHPTRLFMVDEIARHGRKCVCELTAMIGADMSTVSRHLTVLSSAGILNASKQGAQVLFFCELAFPGMVSFLECVDSLMRETARHERERAWGIW